MNRLKELPPFQKPEGEELQKMRERIRRMETEDAERYIGEEPVSAVSVYNELLEVYDPAFRRYYEKRIRVKGIVTGIGPDEFGAPSFQFTDAEKTRCYALIVFPSKDIYEQIEEGCEAEIIGNVTFIREPYGMVVKKCELLNSTKQQ